MESGKGKQQTGASRSVQFSEKVKIVISVISTCYCQVPVTITIQPINLSG